MEDSRALSLSRAANHRQNGADLWTDVWTMLALTYEHRHKINPHASTA